MNYLAHMYLSGNDPELMIGNFIADAVKGRQLERYPERIQAGIRLHRAIDAYTDTHEVVVAGRERLRRYFHKYSGVVIDMYFDHFLASGWEDYSTEPLLDFTHRNYAILSRYYLLLPGRSRRILPHMIRRNLLVAYGSLEGLDHAFRGMARRTPFRSGMEDAVEVLKQEYDGLRAGFRSFFPELVGFAALKREDPIS